MNNQKTIVLRVAIAMALILIAGIIIIPMLFRDDLYDDFESGVYTLKDGQVSPNKKWANIYNGGGSSGVSNELDTSNNVFFMYPNIAKAA